MFFQVTGCKLINWYASCSWLKQTVLRKIHFNLSKNSIFHIFFKNLILIFLTVCNACEKSSWNLRLRSFCKRSTLIKRPHFSHWLHKYKLVFSQNVLIGFRIIRAKWHYDVLVNVEKRRTCPVLMRLSISLPPSGVKLHISVLGNFIFIR